MTERLIERSFPIVQLNPLSVRERNAFKPVYKMHKWFARRSSSIFRAILLGAALPSEQDGQPVDLMKEFYAGHGDDPRLKRADGTPMRVLDPFMGGGTTVVEALRLGFDVTGVDYNPIAWFIVKGETTPVDLDALDAAYERVAAKVKDELLELYKTTCPITGEDADIIYGFWVKQGICVDPACKAVTDLFKSYVVGRIQGDLGLFYLPDVRCPHCTGAFDWELERCTITAGGPQLLGVGAGGKSRPVDTAFGFGMLDSGVDCPHCLKRVERRHLGPGIKRKKKKVLVQAVIDPSTGDFFEVRGEVPDEAVTPVSRYRFRPKEAPASGGKFSCSSCGRTQAIVESARAHGGPLPFRYYGYFAYTPHARDSSVAALSLGLPTNNDKWFGATSASDLARVQAAQAELARVRDTLPLPDQEIYDGYNTNRLVIHQYKRWSELFGSRQLLALGRLLKAIAEEPQGEIRDALLGALQSHLDNSSRLTGYDFSRNMVRNVTAAHDFRNPTSIAENNTWGIAGAGRAPFSNCVDKYRAGLEYRDHPDLTAPAGAVEVADVKARGWNAKLSCGSSTGIDELPAASFDLVITDPPYAGSVQYAEMSDWSYVWLHHVLKDQYPDEFGPEITLKSQEIIEDGAHKDVDFFFDNLTEAWRECHRVLVDDGLLAFTFHHKEGDRWTGLLRSLFDAGFYLVAAYPTHSEALNSIVIQATKGITYDIVHVCRKRLQDPEPIPWTVLRKEVLATARAQLKEIEGGRDVLPGPDVQMILLGKALMLFSKHYGKVEDSTSGGIMELDEAMERILVLVREVRGEAVPLPGPLQDIDALSQIALLHTVGRGPWTRDGLHLELRGYAHDLESLIACGLVEADPSKKASLRSVPALDRWAQKGESLDPGLRAPLIDRLHRLLGTLHQGGDPALLFRASVGEWGQLREGIAYLAKRERGIKDLCELAIRALDARGPEPTPAGKRQGSLFGDE